MMVSEIRVIPKQEEAMGTHILTMILEMLENPSLYKNPIELKLTLKIIICRVCLGIKYKVRIRLDIKFPKPIP